MFRFASDGHEDAMPPMRSVATRLGRRATDVHKNRTFDGRWQVSGDDRIHAGLRPVGKSQVKIASVQWDDGSVVPTKVHTVFSSSRPSTLSTLSR